MQKIIATMRSLAACATLTIGLALSPQAAWAAQPPVKLAVITPTGITPGKAIVNAAKLAVADLNEAGGIDGRNVELRVYDSQMSTTAAVRAMQKAVQEDHVAAVTGVFLSEISLALAQYAGRLDTPLILDSGTTKIGELVHQHYDRYRNVFQLQLNSHFIAQEVCDAAKSLLLDGGKTSGTAVIMSEHAAWTKPLNRSYQECLPKSGFKVLKEFDYEANTKDFGPIYNQIASMRPTVIVTGMAHTGLRPVLQWHQKQVPSLMLGFNMQAGSGDFWERSNKAAQGLVVVTNGGAGGAAITPKTVAFYKKYMAQYHDTPMLAAYTSYDAIKAVASAIAKAGSTKTSSVVSQLEKTNMEGVTGRIKFYGRDAKYTHALMYGHGLVPGVAFQWQDGKQTVVWPDSVAQGGLVKPDFVKSSD